MKNKIEAINNWIKMYQEMGDDLDITNYHQKQSSDNLDLLRSHMNELNVKSVKELEQFGIDVKELEEMIEKSCIPFEYGYYDILIDFGVINSYTERVISIIEEEEIDIYDCIFNFLSDILSEFDEIDEKLLSYVEKRCMDKEGISIIEYIERIEEENGFLDDENIYEYLLEL